LQWSAKILFFKNLTVFDFKILAEFYKK
jgi:hypothetical protein